LEALGQLDSLLTSVIVINITKTGNQSIENLIGKGIGNAMARNVLAHPGAGSTTRHGYTLILAVRTRLSGAIHGFFY